MECGTQVAFEWVSSKMMHLMSQVTASKPRQDDERMLLSGSHATAHTTVTSDGFALACFPDDPSGRKEKVLSCVPSPSSRDGNHTLRAGTVCAEPSQLWLQLSLTQWWGWAGRPTVAFPNCWCSGALGIWKMWSHNNVLVKLTHLKQKCLVLKQVSCSSRVSQTTSYLISSSHPWCFLLVNLTFSPIGQHMCTFSRFPFLDIGWDVG